MKLKELKCYNSVKTSKGEGMYFTTDKYEIELMEDSTLIRIDDVFTSLSNAVWFKYDDIKRSATMVTSVEPAKTETDTRFKIRKTK